MAAVHADVVLDQVGRYQVYEIELTAERDIDKPFDVYLLRIELTSPSGRKRIIDGFFDGDGNGGQTGRVWKARICPDEAGIWRWETIPGDESDSGLEGWKGCFECIEDNDPGGVTRKGKYFQFQSGEYIYLQGNFLDFVHDLPSTHVYMSDRIKDSVRSMILERQRDYHKVNKINIYIANKGDYGGIATTPWVTNRSGCDFSAMNISAWARFDKFVVDIKRSGMLAELWFFADDSGFGKLPQTDKNRLFRYAMARMSAYNHTMFVIALEWQEGWSPESVRASGRFIQNHNPWHRLLSVHSVSVKSPDTLKSMLTILYRTLFKKLSYSNETWADFIASQAGNNAGPEQVNSLAVEINTDETIPHIGEEFGILRHDGDLRLMRNMWANLCGGATGGGTGDYIANLMKFIQDSGIPFQRMTPSNWLIKDGENQAFCLAESGHHYLVFSGQGGFKLEVEGEDLSGYWFDPVHPQAELDNKFPVQQGTMWYYPPGSGKDWVFWITDGKQLNDLRLYPSKTMEIIKNGLRSKKSVLGD